MPGDINIVVQIDQAQVERVTKALRTVAFGSQRAISSSINRALAKGRTLISKRVRAEVNITQKAILRAITIHKSNQGKLNGDITVSRQPIKLGEYKPQQTPQGVRVQVRRSRGSEVIPHTFLATMSSGHTGVFVRKMIGGKRAPRLPIRELYGPTAVGVLGGVPGLLDGISAEVSAEFARRLDSQVSRFVTQPEAQ